MVLTTMWPKVSVSLIKKSNSLLIQKIMQVRDFERYVPFNIKTNSCSFMFNDGSISTP